MYEVSSYEDSTYDYKNGILAFLYSFHRFIFVGQYESYYHQVKELLIEADGNHRKLKDINDLINWNTPRATKNRNFSLRQITSFTDSGRSMTIRLRDRTENSIVFVKPEDCASVRQGLLEVGIPEK